MLLARPTVRPVALPRLITMRHGSPFLSSAMGFRISSSGIEPQKAVVRILEGMVIVGIHHASEVIG